MSADCGPPAHQILIPAILLFGGTVKVTVYMNNQYYFQELNGNIRAEIEVYYEYTW